MSIVNTTLDYFKEIVIGRFCIRKWRKCQQWCYQTKCFLCNCSRQKLVNFIINISVILIGNSSIRTWILPISFFLYQMISQTTCYIIDVLLLFKDCNGIPFIEVCKESSIFSLHHLFLLHYLLTLQMIQLNINLQTKRIENFHIIKHVVFICGLIWAFCPNTNRRELSISGRNIRLSNLLINLNT